MYTVGLINDVTIRTSVFKSLEEAMTDIKHWKKCIMNNNIVESRTTLSKRNEFDTIVSIKDVFEIRGGKELILFLSKSN